jgi:hypothetical protein
MVLSLLGALKWQVSNEIAAAAREGNEPSAATRDRQRLLGSIAGKAMSLWAPELTNIGLFLKHRVVDVSSRDGEYWERLFSELQSGPELIADELDKARRVMDF